eukprot:766978-Hanusia_phi.AAC.2
MEKRTDKSHQELACVMVLEEESNKPTGEVSARGCRSRRIDIFGLGRRDAQKVVTSDACMLWVDDACRLAKECGLEASALRDVTERISELGDLLQGLSMIQEVSPKLQARICSYGEQMSTRLAVQILKHNNIKASLIQSGDLLLTDTPLNAQDTDKYLNANVFPKCDPIWAENVIESKVGPADVIVTQGFVAKNVKGESCLLGRGGSDTSGSLFAALVAAHHLEIWTDVYGMFSGDPRKMPHARLIQRISSREAQELATSGAKVLHPRCIAPAAMYGVPIEIHNTMDPDSEYTVITVDDFCKPCEEKNGLPKKEVQPSASRSPLSQSPFASPRNGSSAHGWNSTGPKSSGMGIRRMTHNDLTELDTRPPAFAGVVAQPGCVMLTLTTMEMWGATGFLYRCFAPFHDFSISVDHVATSQSGISVTTSHIPGGVEGDAFKGLMVALEELGAAGSACWCWLTCGAGEVEVCYHVAVVTVVGRRIRERLPDLGKAMSAFEGMQVKRRVSRGCGG